MLALLAAAELLGMSLWFTASAVSPQLSDLWGLTPGEAGWLTTAVQLGFVAGTAVAAVLNLADLLPARTYVAGCAAVATIANAALLITGGYVPALVLRFFTGFFLAGVYPPAMKMVATWFRSARGLAIGTIVGALTIGKALPYLVGAVAHTDYRFVVLTASGGALVAALLVAAGYREGPEPFERRTFSWGLVGSVLRHRETRLAIGGYLGHMWELYAMWTLIALFLLDHFTATGVAATAASRWSGIGAFAAIAAGGVGAVIAGIWADQLGRERITIWAMAVSGTCALVSGWLLGSSSLLIAVIALIWGFSVVADSAQFSAIVTEVAPRHAVGTALTLQTSLGFFLTAISIAATIEVKEQFGWGSAFAMLAIGPLTGIWQMKILERARKQH
jgi:MFS family permease